MIFVENICDEIFRLLVFRGLNHLKVIVSNNVNYMNLERKLPKLSPQQK